MFLLPAHVGLTARELSPSSARDVADAQAVVDACDDYYRLVQGEPAGPDEGLHVLTDLPPGRTLADKRSLAFYTPRPRVCGLLSLLRDHPGPGDWYLTELLLEPQARAHGRGAAVVTEAFRWLTQTGAHRVLIAVADQNTRGLTFWTRLGFEHLRTTPPRRMGGRDTVLHELVYSPSPPGSRSPQTR